MKKSKKSIKPVLNQLYNYIMRKTTKKKVKKLKMLATLREKRHYLVLTANKTTIKEQDIKTLINEAIINFIGILGYAKAGVSFIEQGKTGESNPYFILSVLTKHVDAIKAALTLIKKPQIRCIGVSGTLKKSKRFLIV